MKRKLKTLGQILNEAKEVTRFFNGNSIEYRSDNWKGQWITEKMIPFFGKEIEINPGGGVLGNITTDKDSVYSFEESWFEKPEKKKLYAYSVLIQRDSSLGDIHPEIIFSDKEFEKKGYTRKSEFDIEFDDDK